MSEIWLEFLGDFGAKTGRFIRKNMTENGPQLIRIDLNNGSKWLEVKLETSLICTLVGNCRI